MVAPLLFFLDRQRIPQQQFGALKIALPFQHQPQVVDHRRCELVFGAETPLVNRTRLAKTVFGLGQVVVAQLRRTQARPTGGNVWVHRAEPGSASCHRLPAKRFGLTIIAFCQRGIGLPLQLLPALRITQ